MRNEHPFTILIVDDNQNNLFTLEAILKGVDNCRIVQALSGEEALAATVEYSVNLILLDVQMPGMDGYETSKHLKMTARTRDIPVIFLTAIFKTEEFIKRGFELGAINYLTKPLDENQLLNQISLYHSLYLREIALHEVLEKLKASSEASFHDLFEGSMDAIIIYDMEYGFVDCNKPAIKLYGCTSKQQLLHKHPGALSPPIQPNGLDSIALANEYIHRALIEGGIQFEWVHSRQDGSLVTVDIQLSSLNWKGRPVVQASMRDITERKAAALALEEKEERLTLATLCSGVGIWDWNIQTRELIWDESMLALYQIQQANFSGTLLAWEAALFPKDRERVMQEVHAAISGEKSLDNEFRICWPNGEIRHIKAAGKVFYDEQGRALHLLGTNVDITKLKSAEARLKLAASVFSHAREGIIITDAANTILEVNDFFSTITGYSREEALGQNPSLLKSNRQAPEFYIEMWQTLQEKNFWCGEIWNQRKNGEVFPGILTISAVTDVDGKIQNYVALFSDITLMKEHQHKLEQMAHFDTLTGLPNRVLLADRLCQAIRQCQRRNKLLAVLFLDLDGFKAVNDVYGHNIGDQLLICVSQRMSNALREGDTLSRVGGDEFVAVLVDMEMVSNCEIILERLLQAATVPIIIENAELKVSTSIGVTFYPHDPSDADQLIRHADQAMYVAKQAGKNRFHFFDIEQDVAIKTQHESLDHIRRALEQHEFVLFYQPKVNLKTGEVVGAEALIRWQHPERGLIPPSEFLPIIENHPISIELGEWVIATALNQMSEWHALGYHIPVSVNVGAKQLQQADFVSRISTLLATHSGNHSGPLELEILETSALKDLVTVTANILACRDLGVQFALDDFGTGYSSLTYLKHLPVDTLKIDKSFVANMLNDPDDLAIVNGVIGLASSFQRQVIAEGVETIAHGTQLIPMGCVWAQGYGIARPMPAHEMQNWIANWKQNTTWSVYFEGTDTVK